MVRCVKTIAVFVSLVLVPAAAYAQASIVGTVRDPSGGVLPGVTVEASSPVLIEKTRTVVTGGTGQYAIEDLRPGTYIVTFSLSAFSTLKREGIELTGSFVATINAEMKVGGVAETVTVTSETPVVDVTSTRNQQVISGQTVAEIPSSRQYSAFTHLIPAINVQGNDFEGSNPALYSVFQIHGGRRDEGKVLVDGMNAGYQGMGVSGYMPEIGNSQEVVFTLGGGLGEAITGGPTMNVVGKQGGNRFAGSFFVSGTGSALQGDNLTADVKAKGLTAANAIKKLWDVNPSLGGPIVRDKLWFFGTYRYQFNRQYVASMWVNKSAGDPTKWNYDPDYTQQAVDDGTWKNGSVRLTWQPTPRNKINAWSGVQYHCQHCIGGGDGTGLGFGALIRSPEGASTDENHPSLMTQVSWASPVTNRLLLEANVQLGPYFWWGSRQKDAFDATLIPVQDDGGPIPHINYRGANWFGHTAFTNIVQASASYVTGSHSAKFGFRYFANDANYPVNYYNNSQLKYNFQDGVPTQVTAYADANSHQEQKQGIFALYAQDRWTIGRLSLQAGLRFERLGDYFPQQQFGPNLFMPTAAVFPAQDGPLNQKDLQPRFGASYDVFGNGKTAAKFFLGRYVTTTDTVVEWLNYSPAGFGQFVTSDTRSWADANRDYVVNCNLLNPAPNGECGPGNPSFGKQVKQLTVDPATTSGWNTREYSWDLTAGVTQQVAPRVSVEVDYIRRSWGNLRTTINRAWKPTDFDAFVFSVPRDVKLPNGGGYDLTFYDVKPGKYAQFDNFLTFSDNVGGAFNGFNGVDFTVNARLSNVTIQGGTSTGNVVEDDCGVSAQHPEIYIFGPWGGTAPFLTVSPGGGPGGLGQWPQAFCHRESAWQTNVKGLATYTVPKIDMLISGTFRSLPIAGNEFPSVATQSLGGQVTAVQIPGVFTQTNLGRGFSSGIPVEFLNIVKPGVLYGDRLNSVDLRFGKILKHGNSKTLVALDIFNVTNSNTSNVYQQAYGTTYLNPLSITAARFFKIGVQIDF